MQTYIMLTRLSPEAVKNPSTLTDLEKAVADKVEKECPEVKWVSSYAVLGPCDYLDIFTAPDSETAAKVAVIVRTFGHATTEIWNATEWQRFKSIVQGMV